MNCPKCIDVILNIEFKHGVEIDHCPNCDGIWLDKNELVQLIKRISLSSSDAESIESFEKRDTSPELQAIEWSEKAAEALEDVFEFQDKSSIDKL